MRTVLLALLVATMLGCDESLTGPTAPVDKEFLLAPGESSVVEDITIRFVRVAADSRCPADVTCVWMGDAHVQIVVTSTGGAQEHDLHTSDMKPVTHDGYTIHLVKVEPYPYSSKTIQPDDYRVTFKVTKS